ncbi:type III secretion system chaperone [Shewanella sp. 202IG2-18]|uniref:CesT family type III secretion system chaperone n=1 Tax=Parashewanella hymeniacidonis TaxID=2807618 RepID=UPI00195FEB5C|nr:type III secretion system chaperone [Parashewanella hymeniacidonis]
MKSNQGNIYDAINLWFEQLGLQLGLQLKLEENGHIQLNCGGFSVTVEVSDLAGAIFFYSKIIELPKEQQAREAAYVNTLEANAFGILTNGAHLALSEAKDAITLTFALSIEAIDGSTFLSCLSEFINTVKGLKDKNILVQDKFLNPTQHCLHQLNLGR